MQTIKTKSHEFRLEMDLPTLLKIKRELGINLVTKQGIEIACSSFLELAPIVLEAIRSQVQKLNLSDDEVLNELLEVRSAVVDAWVEAMRNFSQRAGYVALARVAAAMVEIAKQEERISAELMDEATAKQLVSKSVAAEVTSRRRQLDRLLADVSAAADDPSTPGKPLPSSQPSPASTLTPNL